MCMTYRKYFTSPANQNSHMITHVKKNIICPGCSSRFSRDSAVLLHLEAGTCVSGVDIEDVTQLAFDCNQAEDYTSYNPDFDFKSPRCQTSFAFISGLLQHAESGCCDKLMERDSSLGKFLRLSDLALPQPHKRFYDDSVLSFPLIYLIYSILNNEFGHFR
ncbi:hypothetical protein BDV29DRAFT_179524 [Aspergillus leporis]|uniref:C2H2-type domain-containing protein n=1 Tax=Aspergillus leporis TaxID=41062 RepID=A0A5N5WW00_9EURO|nr:hypothetical protein BDV29DRAFT_179524 [Aspergillus leporis]